MMVHLHYIAHQSPSMKWVGFRPGLLEPPSSPASYIRTVPTTPNKQLPFLFPRETSFACSVEYVSEDLSPHFRLTNVEEGEAHNRK